MNKRIFLLLAAAALFVENCLAADAPSDFVDVPWGASPTAAHRIMAKRPGVLLTSESPQQLCYVGGTFAGEHVVEWKLQFTDSRFSSGSVSFTPIWGKDAKGLLIDQLKYRLLQQVEQKYGKSKKTEDNDHREYNWRIVEKLSPARAKTIRLFHGWQGSRLMELAYSDVLSAPTNPKVKDKDDF